MGDVKDQLHSMGLSPGPSRSHLGPSGVGLVFNCRQLEMEQTLEALGIRQGSTVVVTGRWDI